MALNQMACQRQVDAVLKSGEQFQMRQPRYEGGTSLRSCSDIAELMRDEKRMDTPPIAMFSSDRSIR